MLAAETPRRRVKTIFKFRLVFPLFSLCVSAATDSIASCNRMQNSIVPIFLRVSLGLCDFVVRLRSDFSACTKLRQHAGEILA